MDPSAIPEETRQQLLDYLMSTSAERARMIAELERMKRGAADLLAELEADYDLRTRFEIELLKSE